MKEYTIDADDIFDFKKQLNKFFEENPTAEIDGSTLQPVF